MTIRHAIFNCLIAFAALTLPVQFLIDPSVENIACTCTVFAASLVVLLYLRETTALKFHPLSSFAILGFCMTSQLGALLVQTCALTSLTHSLSDPLYTFCTLALYQLIAVCAHAAYRFFSVRKATDVNLIRGVLDWAGVYRIPSCGTLWYMGCIGLPTFFLWAHEGVLAKLVNGFTFLVWAPFLIPFYSREFGDSYCNARLNRFLLVGYSAVIAVFGLALNARGIIFAGAVTIALLYLLAGMRSTAPVTGRAVFRICALAVILVAIGGPMSDLATSMAIVRQVRGKVSATVMIRSTLHVWGQPSLIAAYRADQQVRSRYGAYDEYYIANPLLARFVETKFYDSSFHFARTLTTERAKQQLRDVSIKFAWAGLPTPVLNALGIPIDKDDLNYSMGDYLAYLSRGVPLGGRKTGNMFAQGIALFGPLFPFIYAAICIPLFGLLDLLTIRPVAGMATLSALGMLQIWEFFLNGITFESLHSVFHLFLRYFAQTLAIYVLVLATSRQARSAKTRAGPPNAAAWPRPT